MKTTMRMISGVLLIVLVLAGVAGPTKAKGPESVVISGPGIGAPIELADTASPELMSDFMEQTGLWFASGDLPTRIDAPQGDLGEPYTVSWVNLGPPHLPPEERTFIQYIYLNTEYGHVIHTPEQETLSGWGSDPAGWFLASEALPDTMKDLGIPVRSGGVADLFSGSGLTLNAVGAATPIWYAAAVLLVMAGGLFGVVRMRGRTG